MPNINKELVKCKHPNSRKTKALAKKTKKMNNREKTKMGHAIKANIMGEKFNYFTEKLEDKQEALRPEEFLQLIESYLRRFDEELEQIKLKQSISKNRAHQHFSRENSIKMTLEKENSDFNGGGLQLMDLCDTAQFQSFKEWDGNAMSLQHLKIDPISRKMLLNKIDSMAME